MKLKAFFIFGTIVITLIIAILLLKPDRKSNSENITDVLGAPATTANLEDVLYNGATYRAQWFEVKNADQITLDSNLIDKLPANKIHETQNCQYLVNAGFYTPDDKPIGYFLSDGQILRSEITSPTFNGFFSINDFATSRITNVLPLDHLRLALQSGPVLIENSFLQKLSINNDKPARRSIVATTSENHAVFIVVYDPESQFNGPFLADLPEILKIFQSEVDIILADALNLDGGTASAFYTPEVGLSELSPIGSYFCIR